MKISYISSVVFLWLIGRILVGIAEASNAPITAADVAALPLQPQGSTDVITKVWDIILGFFQFIFLWSPTLWTGTWLWVYYFLVISIASAIVFGIILAVRGVGSS